MVDFTGLSRGLNLVTFLNKRDTMPNHKPGSGLETGW